MLKSTKWQNMRTSLSIRQLIIVLIILGTDLYSDCSLAFPKRKPLLERTTLQTSHLYTVLDVDKVVNQSVAYIEFKGRWDKENEKYQKEIEFYESQLLELEKKITEENSDKLDVVQIKQKIGTYEVKVQGLLRKRTKVLEGAFNKAIKILRENIDKLIADYAKQNGNIMIFSRDQVIYFADAADITNAILAKLNDNLKKLEVTI